MITWTCTSPGRWTGANEHGVTVATATRTREGALHGNGIMWYTTLNGAWLTNADSLCDAKRAVKLASDLDACVTRIIEHQAAMQAALDLGETEVGTLRQHPRPLLANDRAALASNDAAVIRTHAVHL